MKKFLGLAALLLSAQAAMAACLAGPAFTCGQATRYDVRVQEVALCSDAACTSRYVVGSGAKTFDIASGTAGSAIGSYAKVDAVPVGVYTHVRLVLDRTFVISGPVVGACAQQNGTSLSIPNDGTADAGLTAIGVSWNDPGKTQLAAIGALPTSMVVTKAGRRPAVMVKFDTQDGLMCANGGPTPMPGLPTTTLSVF